MLLGRKWAGRRGRPDACTHECSETNGCITKKLNCQHEHDESCGYKEAQPEKSCGYVCEICSAGTVSGDPTESEPECTCETRCTEGNVNKDCPVCSLEDGDLTLCQGSEASPSSDGAQTSVEKVQDMIDALPTAEELKAMSLEEQQKVYNDLNTAYDAYEALTNDEKQEVSGADIFNILFAVFNGMVAPLADSDGFTSSTEGTTQTYTGGSGDSLTINEGSSLANVVFAVTDTLSVTNQLSMSMVNADFQSGAVSAGSVSFSEAGKTLTVSGGQLTSQGSVSLTSGASLSVTDGALSAQSISVQGSGASLSVSGGEVTTSGDISLSQLAELKVSNGTLTSSGNISLDYNATISGGLVKANSLKANTTDNHGTTSISITGGTVDISGEISSTGTGNSGSGSVTVNGDAIVFANSITKQSNGDDAAQNVTSFDKGVVFINKTGTVYGDVTLPGDLEIPSDYTLNIPQGVKLTIPENVTLTNNGTISGQGTLTGDGNLVNTGEVNVTNNSFGNSKAVGDFLITGDASGYSYSDGVLTVNNGANLTIFMANGATDPTSDRIVIANSATATITLAGVNIQVSNGNNAIDLGAGSNLTLILANGSTNKLVAGNATYIIQGSGVHVTRGTTLTIQCSDQGDDHTCSESCGKLTIESGCNSAGIGGKENENCGTVVIDGGIVTATGNAAGIGGGDHGSGGNVTINGGIVTATGNNGAGIGGAGSNGPGVTTTITGGVVKATGAGGGAGIGGGWESGGGTVIITGGIVQATVAAQDFYGAGIGGGHGATDNGTFSTSTDSTTGNAVIFASSNLAGNEIGDLSNFSDWSGVIFQGTIGMVHGNVTLTDSFEVPSAYALFIRSGSKLTIPENLTVTNNGTIIITDDGELTPTIRVTGRFIFQSYTVTFEMNNVGTPLNPYLALNGGKISSDYDNQTAEGYTFLGWYKESNFQTRWNFETDTVTATMTLYARWEVTPTVTTYQVTVNNGTGSGEYAVGAEVTIGAIVPSGKVFSGWSITPNVTFTNGGVNTETATFIMPNQLVTVTANFKDTGGTSSGSSSGSDGTSSDSSVIIIRPDQNAPDTSAKDEGSLGTWKKDETGWWFSYTADNSYAKDGWHRINGEWYSFDDQGYMETGWKYDVDYESWFYLRDSGAMVTGWFYDEVLGSWFYMDDSGAMVTGWFYDEALRSWFYMDDSGAMVTGWLFDVSYDGWFYLSENGAMVTGWFYDVVTNVWYYLKPNGIMAADEITPDGYRVNSDGAWTE